MGIKLLTVLLVLPAIYARIEIDVIASENEMEREVTFSGKNVDIISDEERMTFKLDDANLKMAARSYFGRKPDEAYLKSPTPWGDLYKTYNWPEVTRTLTPLNVKILSVYSEPAIVATQILHNNSTKQAQFSAKITQDVQNKVSSTWQRDGELTVDQDIKYGVVIKVISMDTTKFSFTNKWGESVSKSQSMTVGSQSGVTIALEPNQKVMAELYATQGTMKLQVDYEASLSGSVAVNYDDEYKGHHFWSLDVNTVMKAGGMKNSVKSSEIIDVTYYTDARVLIKDMESEMVMFSIPMNNMS